MVGGTIIEVSEVAGRPEVLFVDCRDRTYSKDTCAIFVERNTESERIEIGDQLWWQGSNAYWTPQANRKPACNHREHDDCGSRSGVDYDIRIPRVGYSGVKHPARTSGDD